MVMIRRIAVVAIVVICCLGFRGFKDVKVPDVQGRQADLYASFDRLAAMGAYLQADDGKFLGKFSKSFSQDSLGNEVGPHGSTVGFESIFNEVSRYGGDVALDSPFNAVSIHPPHILVKVDGDIYDVGVLTVNNTAITHGQRISPYALRAWLKS